MDLYATSTISFGVLKEGSPGAREVTGIPFVFISSTRLTISSEADSFTSSRTHRR